MAVLTVSEGMGANAYEIPEDTYAATIEELTPTRSNKFLNKATGEFQDQYLIRYLLTDVETSDTHEPIYREQYVTASLNMKSTLYAICQQVLYNGEAIPKGTAIDPEIELTGKPCSIFWGARIQDDGTSRMGVIKVSPPAGTSPAAAGLARKAQPREADADADMKTRIDAI